MSDAGALERAIDALERSGIPYMLTGSFASAFHGVPRATQDVDLVISPTRAQLARLREVFPPADYYLDERALSDAYDRESLVNVVELSTGWKIDLIMMKSREFSRAEFDRRRRVTFGGVTLYVARGEDVVLSKLEWAKLGESRRQIDDAAGILRARGDLDLEYVAHWVERLGLEREWVAACAAAAGS